MSLIQWFALSNIERVINLAISLDPITQDALSAYAGKHIVVNITGLDLSVTFKIENTGFSLLKTPPESPEVILTGPPISLMRLALGNQALLSSGDIDVSGDLVLLQALKVAMERLDIDLEEPLARFFGDVVAHEAINLHKKMKQRVINKASVLHENIKEFLVEENECFIARAAVNEYISQVNDVRLASDRLDARVKRLINIINETNVGD